MTETTSCDVVIVGAGAAGLATAIAAGREARPSGEALRIVVVDGADPPGRKILVSGGGRCNVTHDVVEESSFCGSTAPAIRKVLRRFDVADTIDWFRELGVELVREDRGKLFPASGRARDVLAALLDGARGAGARLVHPFRVESVEVDAAGFVVCGPRGRLRASRVVLATGGRSLPRTGSDGHGFEIARLLGHSIAEPVVPALVPLVLPDGHFLRQLSGISAEVRLEVRNSSGRRLASAAGPLLCTHFGLSGPAVLDASRHLLVARACGDAPALAIDWLPTRPFARWEEALLARPSIGPARFLREAGLAERLADALCRHAGVEPSRSMHDLPRTARRALLAAATGLVVPVDGDRGFDHAEVTAGGVPLAEIRLDTMESRRCPGLHLVGEICDVDGRIGGYNFQWAWASGFVAGRALGRRSAGVTIAGERAGQGLAPGDPPRGTSVGGEDDRGDPRFGAAAPGGVASVSAPEASRSPVCEDRLVESRVRIRPAAPGDADVLGDLGGELVRLHHGFDERRFIAPRPGVEAGYGRFLVSRIGADDSVVLVAEDDSGVVGYTFAEIEPHSWKELRDEAGWIHDVVVGVRARRRGVARMLVDAATSWLRARGMPRVMLSTAARNEAGRAAFAAMGFRATMIEMAREIEAPADPGEESGSGRDGKRRD